MPALAAFTGLGGTWLMLAARRRTSPVAGQLARGVLVALLAWGGIEAARQIRHDLLTHRTGARELADQIAPALAPLPPAIPSFRATEPEGLEFRLFRTGLSWEGMTSAAEIEDELRAGRVRCWAYRPDGDVPPLEVRSWLAAHTREVTADVNARAGRVTGLRVFVP